MIEITLAKVAAVLGKIPAALRFWKDLKPGAAKRAAQRIAELL